MRPPRPSFAVVLAVLSVRIILAVGGEASAGDASQAKYFDYMASTTGSGLGACLRRQRDQGYDRWTPGRPMYVTLAGIEGSGHHLFAPVFHAVFGTDGGRARSLRRPASSRQDAPRNVFVNEVKTLMWPTGKKRDVETGILDAATLLEALAGEPKHYAPLFTAGDPVAPATAFAGVGPGNRSALAAALRRVTKERVRLFNGGGSHPFGQPRSPYRFPDLLTLAHLDGPRSDAPRAPPAAAASMAGSVAQTGLGAIDVRVVFFYRNATDAVVSVLRRGFAEDLEVWRGWARAGRRCPGGGGGAGLGGGGAGGGGGGDGGGGGGVVGSSDVGTDAGLVERHRKSARACACHGRRSTKPAPFRPHPAQKGI